MRRIAAGNSYRRSSIIIAARGRLAGGSVVGCVVAAASVVGDGVAAAEGVVVAARCSVVDEPATVSRWGSPPITAKTVAAAAQDARSRRVMFCGNLATIGRRKLTTNR